MRASPWVLAAVLLASCATVPVGRPSLRTDPPTGTVADQRTWLTAEDWEGFTRTVLWPQERALRYWHTFRRTEGRIDLTPAQTLPPAPLPRAVDAGGDPRVWRVDWREGGVFAPSPGARTGETEFTVAEAGGLPPSLYGIQVILRSAGASAGRVRVVETGFRSGRFTVRIEWE